eukprot:TRINITY_DN9121_c0_g1_i1.p2 TRINITY_DN9121_c0_g1~~TRINITY_DN9121_c0_g1_i1.p2  ORF type:complete len:243 (+),score=55.50 TRINITY_DN9121_c0_g1_i1:473-1201(+)
MWPPVSLFSAPGLAVGEVGAASLHCCRSTRLLHSRLPPQSPVTTARDQGRSPLPPLQVVASGFGSGSKGGRGKAVRERATEAGKAQLAKKVTAPPCPCGAEEKPYKECCGRFHGGVREPDAATLMRARYSAFVVGNVPYLLRTMHPDNPLLNDGLAEELQRTAASTEFTRLEVLEETDGGGTGTEVEAFVTFRITFGSTLSDGQAPWSKAFEERSRFVREGSGGRWLYREEVWAKVLEGPGP